MLLTHLLLVNVKDMNIYLKFQSTASAIANDITKSLICFNALFSLSARFTTNSLLVPSNSNVTFSITELLTLPNKLT